MGQVCSSKEQGCFAVKFTGLSNNTSKKVDVQSGEMKVVATSLNAPPQKSTSGGSPKYTPVLSAAAKARAKQWNFDGEEQIHSSNSQVLNLMQRFPEKTKAEVTEALNVANGHAGMAARSLSGRGPLRYSKSPEKMRSNSPEKMRSNSPIKMGSNSPAKMRLASSPIAGA
eukprot:gnl/MRDRNA2_/MRDRNA2_91865_c0_seq1.p2 gnl/MRDRNA2_/MRDRNA2_91865_c0~~gnl/MRDRNA2_/MRDRNA2_91865_c0_seq1.p2  ORF type:complete len:170 (+),score=31.94 gnl/MRDRNA2_/MRDRNA2_91865_c0_seq1:87-596(+)